MIINKSQDLGVDMTNDSFRMLKLSRLPHTVREDNNVVYNEVFCLGSFYTYTLLLVFY